jgi:hypothetical protein
LLPAAIESCDADVNVLSHHLIERRTPLYLAETLAQSSRRIKAAQDSGNGNYATAQPEELAVVVQQLAAGASELRDQIVDAWRQSSTITVGFPLVQVSDIEAGTVTVTPLTFGSERLQRPTGATAADNATHGADGIARHDGSKANLSAAMAAPRRRTVSLRSPRRISSYTVATSQRGVDLRMAAIASARNARRDRSASSCSS